MALLPRKLEPVLAQLLADSAASGGVTLDDVGEAIGPVAVSTDDVDALLTALESAGRKVIGPEGARGVGNLRRVLPAARALAARLGRSPTIAKLVQETGLAEGDVRHALALGKVMGQ